MFCPFNHHWTPSGLHFGRAVMNLLVCNKMEESWVSRAELQIWPQERHIFHCWPFMTRPSKHWQRWVRVCGCVSLWIPACPCVIKSLLTPTVCVFLSPPVRVPLSLFSPQTTNISITSEPNGDLSIHTLFLYLVRTLQLTHPPVGVWACRSLIGWHHNNRFRIGCVLVAVWLQRAVV